VRATWPCGSLEICLSRHNETVGFLRFSSRWGLPHTARFSRSWPWFALALPLESSSCTAFGVFHKLVTLWLPQSENKSPKLYRDKSNHMHAA
jgi:hypothetical protein